MINNTQKKLIEFFLQSEYGQSAAAHEYLKGQRVSVSLGTIKRQLSAMVEAGTLVVEGGGRSTRYRLSTTGRLFARIDARAYCQVDPDRRFGFTGYQFGLWGKIPREIFTEQEMALLSVITKGYHEKITNLSQVLHRKELERFVIEFSWKSSKIEGNTYSLLDTERLISDGIEAPRHKKDEARMILNHKDAFQFILKHRKVFITLTKKNMEDLHALLVRDLQVTNHFRTKPVGVTGSRYQPPDNVYQIGEACSDLSAAVTRMRDGYAKALMTLLGISYIQPFEDGNKRTARLAANAILLAHGLSPLSYRSVDEEEYREAMLVFYELNSLEPFKKIFIEQYEFSASHYAVT